MAVPKEVLEYPSLGPVARCPKCGRETPVENCGSLQIIKCCDIYLVGIDGKCIAEVAGLDRV